jgi:RNA polymerase sigma-70 factor (ECF subfamily)
MTSAAKVERVLREPRADDEEWLRALADDGPGGDAARGDLRRVLVMGLRRSLSSRGVAEDLCEDFAQEALVRIRERLPGFRGESRFTTWALSIAIRIAFDELRHKRWRDVPFESVCEEPAALGTVDAPQEKAVVRGRVLAALQGVIAGKLTPKQRAVLLAELSGMPQAEIARNLQTNANAVYKLSHDARRKVKDHLDSAGISGEDVRWVFE